MSVTQILLFLLQIVDRDRQLSGVCVLFLF